MFKSIFEYNDKYIKKFIKNNANSEILQAKFII